MPRNLDNDFLHTARDAIGEVLFGEKKNGHRHLGNEMPRNLDNDFLHTARDAIGEVLFGEKKKQPPTPGKQNPQEFR